MSVVAIAPAGPIDVYMSMRISAPSSSTGTQPVSTNVRSYPLGTRSPDVYTSLSAVAHGWLGITGL